MAVNPQHYNICLTLCCLVSILWATIPTSECQSAQPTQHGLTYEKNTAGEESSSQMMAFFGQSVPVQKPEVALPEARNITDPVQSDQSSNKRMRGKNNRSALCIAAVSGAGLTVIGVAAVAYALHIRRRKNMLTATLGSSHSLVHQTNSW